MRAHAKVLFDRMVQSTGEVNRKETAKIQNRKKLCETDFCWMKTM